MSVTITDRSNRADMPVASRNNPIHYESQSTNVSPLEAARQVETPAAPEQTRSRERTEMCASLEDTASAETERSFTSLRSVSVGAAVFSTEATVHSSRNDPDELKELSSTAVTTYDSGVKITQIVNVQMQTPDAIVMRILPESLLRGEKKRRVLINITLQSESDHDRKEAETQTSLNDVTSEEINVFSHPDERPLCAVMTASKTVQCFICDKQDCYEIRQPDSSSTFEEALITETFDSNDHLAERKADIKIPFEELP